MRVCITGTPGTGKSEVAKILSKKLKWKLIQLNRLAEEGKLYSGYDKKRKCKIVDLDAMEKEIMKLGGNLVLESHYAHIFPCDFVVVLRCNPKKLRERLKAKGWSKKKIEENVEAEIMEICKTEALETHGKVIEIDTNRKETEEIADDILEKINLLKRRKNK